MKTEFETKYENFGKNMHKIRRNRQMTGYIFLCACLLIFVGTCYWINTMVSDAKENKALKTQIATKDSLIDVKHQRILQLENELIACQSAQLSIKQKTKDLILEFEGGKCDDLCDHGGETNKGVTWSTFVRLAPLCGYVPTKELFNAMPPAVWDAIFDQHWNMFAGLDDISLQAYCTEYSWHSGTEAFESIGRCVNRHVHTQDTLLKYIDNITIANMNTVNSKQLINELVNDRAQFVSKLLNYQKYAVGWERRFAALERLNCKNN